jgi:hypothetical protein
MTTDMTIPELVTYWSRLVRDEDFITLEGELSSASHETLNAAHIRIFYLQGLGIAGPSYGRLESLISDEFEERSDS